jgi:hypothetical protein
LEVGTTAVIVMNGRDAGEVVVEVIGREDDEVVEEVVVLEDEEVVGEVVVREVGAEIVDREEELELFDVDVVEVEAGSFCAEGALRALGLGWLSTYANVFCLSWPEPRESELGNELLSFIPCLPGIAGPLERCLERTCSSRSFGSEELANRLLASRELSPLVLPCIALYLFTACKSSVFSQRVPQSRS